MKEIHAELAAGKWHQLSLCEQLGNIGGEVSRARRWKNRDTKLFDGAVLRALELFELTLEDPRWRGRRHEIARAREVFLDAAQGGKEYQSTLENLNRYFSAFAYCARLTEQK